MRDYEREKSLQTKQEMQNRSERNKARRILLAALARRYGLARAKEMMKGKDVDHIKPLEKGGTNDIANLRLRDPSQNRADKKGVKDPGRKKNPPKPRH